MVYVSGTPICQPSLACANTVTRGVRWKSQRTPAMGVDCIGALFHGLRAFLWYQVTAQRRGE